MSNVEEGRRLAAAAYETRPVSPAGLGPVIDTLIYVFLSITTVIIGLRVCVRFSAKKSWGWDDVLAVVGYLASIPSSVFGLVATRYGLGAPGDQVSQLLQIRALEYFMYYEFLYFAASSLTKVSITLTVVRLCDQLPVYRWIAIGNTLMMIVAATVAGIFVLANCRPFAVYWNPDLGVCSYGTPGLASLEIVSLIGSVFQMLTDFVSAGLPFFLISSLQMPRRTKIALICVLGLGVLASVAAFSRMLFYRYWNTDVYPDTLMYYTGVIVLTSELEVGLGIIAASMPPLRPLFQRLYSTIRTAASLNRSGPSHVSSASSKIGAATQLDAMTPIDRSPDAAGRGRWSRINDDNKSSAGSSQGPIVAANNGDNTNDNTNINAAETGSTGPGSGEDIGDWKV